MAEEIGIKIFADTSKAVGDVDKLDKEVDELGKTTDKTTSKLSDGFKTAAGRIAGAVAAITAAAVAAAKSEREIAKFARQARISADAFKALDFAAKQYGLTGEQVADISKDIADKAGEFATAGTGAFQDFADVMGYTKDQAMAAAKSIQAMSGPEAIQYMVSQMQNAGATTAQMTFALESMGNDLSVLTPLFLNNGQALDELSKKYAEANKELMLTTENTEDLKELSEAWDLLKDTIVNLTKKVTAAVAPVLTAAFDAITNAIATAAGWWRKFMEFLGLDGGGELDVAVSKIKTLKDELGTITEGGSIKGIVELTGIANNQAALDARAREFEAEQAHQERLLELQNQKGQQALDQRARRYEQEQKLKENTNATILQNEQATQDNLLAMGQAFAKKGSMLSKALFAFEKGLAIARIIANTTAEATKFAANPPLAASIEATGYTRAALVGALSVAELSGGRAGGGQVSGGNTYRVGEIGPEIFEDRAGRAMLIPGPDGGKVTPVKPAVQNNNSVNVTVQNNAPGVTVEPRQNGNNLEIIIKRAVDAVKNDFVDSIRTGYGDFSDALNGSYAMERRF
jgi:hypothetical protein